MKRCWTALAAALLLAGAATAQQEPVMPALVVLPLEVRPGAGGIEAALIEDRVSHHIVESGEFRVLDTASRDALLREIEVGGSAASAGGPRAGALLAARGAVAGSLAAAGNALVLTLRLVKVETGETLRSASDVFASPDELLRNLRALTRHLVGLEEYERGAAVAPAAPAQPAAALQAVAGRWSGDRGLAWVRVGADGAAVGRFANGASMRLAVSARAGRYVFEQAEPNRSELYESYFDSDISGELALVARPMVWIFELSPDGRTLSGRKDTTSISVERGRISSYDNDYSRPAVWRREE